ncbi:MAG: HlyD family efflux transporter periplasmic adaptor subunit [Clostridiales bacterium]|nr:HlyD family efflux transporter periplasmic adaptor subunit [Clostridiales bacterium]
MKQKLQKIFHKIKKNPFLHKKPLYLVLAIVLSVLLLADVALAVLLPDMGSMGNVRGGQTMQDMEWPDSSGDTDTAEDTGDADSGSSADADSDSADGSSSDNADESDADSENSDAADSENEGSANADTDGADTDSDSMSDMRGGTPGQGESSDESSGMPDMSAGSDGEMPDMSSMGDGEMPDMSSMGDGEMPDMSSTGDSSDDLSADGETDFAGGSFDMSDAAGTQQSGMSVISVLQAIRSHWLLILIILAILDAGSIFMLIRISRRLKREEEAKRLALLEQNADGEVHLARPKKKESKHSHYLWIIAVVVIVLLVLIVKALTGQTTSSGTETEETTYSETAELGTISTVLPGTGTLEEEDAEVLSLPDEVEITKWYVSDGDTVEEGDTLAAVDSVSVMTAIASVQETLTSLDEALEDCEEDAVSGTITAAADGRVIKIYASADTAVVDTMYESDALMLLSLDGYMAVSFETDADISAGDSVDVTLSDGTVVSGKVESVASTTAVVILSDDGPELGDAVTVADEDGTVIGEGTLYIHSELKVTGFTGTVSSISVSEGDEVDSGDTLISLTDTDYTGQYELLLEQRAELEEQMETLFKLYEDGYIYASCSGVISGLNDATGDTSSADDSSASDEDASEESTSDEDADTLDEDASDSSSTADATSYTESSTSDSDTASAASSDSSSAAVTSEMAASVSSGYGVQTLSASGNTSVYLTITSGQSAQATTLSSVSDSSSGSGDTGTDDDTSSSDTSTDGTSTDNTSTDGTTTEDSSEEESDEDETDTSSVTTYIGVITSVSDSSVTLSLLTESGSKTLSLDSSTSVTIYNGSTSQGTVSDIAAGDVLIVSYSGDTLSWILCISSDDASSDSDESSEEESGTEGQSEEEMSQADISDSQEGASQGSVDESGQQSGQSGSEQSQGDAAGTVSGEASDMSSAGDMSSASAAEATGTTEAEEAAEEALEEEVSSTYGVSETTLLSITPQNSMTVEITVDEMDILEVEIGQEAAITLDAFPGQSFTGTVTSIDESGTNSGGSSKYTAVITMDREEGMLAGMNASAVITLSTAEDVLLVSEDALVEENNTTYVYTTYDEETDTLGGLVEVTTGLSDGENVEITSGLEEGDTYCYSILDVVNYSSSYASTGSGSFSLESVFGGGGR